MEFNRASDNAVSDFSDVRSRDILSKLIHSNLADEQQLRQAHEILANDANYASAMHAAASALRELSGGKIEVTLGAEFARDIPGRDYKEVIKTTIARAHWFVLLLSDPKRNNDWCMFETGMFRANMISKQINRLICIHHPETQLPSPIQEFQAVPAQPARLLSFFDGLFRENQPMPGWPALNPDADERRTREFADRIVCAVKGPSRPVAINYSAIIDVAQPMGIEEPADLDACHVSTDARTADLFGKMAPPSTWGELIEHTRRGGLHDQWLTELAAIIHKACRNDRFRPISGTFECPQSGRVMRPVLESIERDVVAGGYSIRLLFVEDPYSTPLRTLPASMQMFLRAYRTNSRLRWELVERFLHIDWTPGEAEACGHVLSRIEREGGSFSQWDLDALCQNYAAEVQFEIRRIVSRWRELRRTGAQPGSDRTGLLDEALSQRDVEQLRPLLDECASLVNDFLRLSHPIMERITLG